MITLSPRTGSSTCTSRTVPAAPRTAAFVTVVAIASAWFGTGAALAGGLAAGGAGAWVDARTGRIPNRLVALVALAATVGVVAEAGDAGATAAVSAALLGMLGVGAPLFAVHLAGPAAVGFGDVKLAGALGATVGLVDPRSGLVVLCIAAGATALYGLVLRRSVVPLGPGLVLGAVVAAALGGRVWE